MLPPEFVRKLPFRLRSNFLPWWPPFSKVLQDELKLLLHFFYKGNHGHSLVLYFLHGSLKFVRIIKKKEYAHPHYLHHFLLLVQWGCWMDSPVVVLENSSGFLFVLPRLELFLLVLLLQHQILGLGTLKLSYSLILVAFSSKNQVPSGVPKICLVDFLVKFTKTYKKHRNK